MSWDDIRRRVLNPIQGVLPHDTSAYGSKTDRPPGSSNPHGGVDFNYLEGRTAKLNLSNPALRAPVDGIVENAGEGDVGRIAIRDKNGFLHELLHTHTRHVSVGDPVVAGQLIGTMGNTGVLQKNVDSGDHHVHYQLSDPAGNRINPTAFWDQGGPADPNPDPPVYLDVYQQYTHGFGGNAGQGSGNAPAVVSAPEMRSLSAPSNEIAPVYARETRSLGRRVTGQSFFKTGVSAVSVVPPNPVLSRDRSNSFSDRFGTWTSSADGIASDNSNQAAAQPGVAPAVMSNAPERYLSRRIVDGPQASAFDTGAPPVTSLPPNDALSPGRPAAFSDRFGNWTASPDDRIAPRNPNLPMPPPEIGRPLGIVSGQPMPQWITPPPIFGQRERSKAPVDEGREWLMRLIRSLGND